MVATLRRLVVRTADPDLEALLHEVTGYDNVAALLSHPAWVPEEAPLLVACRLLVAGGELSLFSNADDFGTPRDITLEELAVELFFPADEATERVLRDPGSGQDAPGQGVAPVP